MNILVKPLKKIKANKSDVRGRSSTPLIAQSRVATAIHRFSDSILCALFLLLPIFAGCNTEDKKPVPPEDLIEKSVFIEMVADQFTIEAVIYNTPPESNKKSISAYMYQEWLDKYHTTPEAFQRSVDYYLYTEKNAKKIMGEVRKKIQEKS